MGSQVCLMPKPVPRPRCHAASRSPVVLQRDPAAPHLPGALSSRVLFDQQLCFVGDPKMGQAAPHPRIRPVANFDFWVASRSEQHPAAYFGHGDGGGVPPGGCLWRPAPFPGAAGSCQWDPAGQRGCSLLKEFRAPGGPSSVAGPAGASAVCAAACPVPLACLCSSSMATCPSSRT